MLSVAWGRLEGHVTGNLLTIMTVQGTTQLPLKWDNRLDLWRKVFRSVPGLQPHKERAVALMKSIIDAATDRNFAAHAVWEDFELDAVEPTMTARAIKAKKDATIEVDDRRITLSMVKRALEECNRLNRELAQFTNLLASLAPPPHQSSGCEVRFGNTSRSKRRQTDRGRSIAGAFRQREVRSNRCASEGARRRTISPTTKPPSSRALAFPVRGYFARSPAANCALR
jgi:hypothetical protein